jgi:anti-anti-sigma regulatory factor
MQEGYRIEGNTLYISVDLDMKAQEDFQAACAALLEREGPRIGLDLTECGFVGSAFFGEMFMLNYRARKAGKDLVIRANRRLMPVMELLGLPKLVTIMDDDS